MTVVAADDSPERFGRYTLLKPLASGGMAEIHLASFEGVAGVPKLVAIKRILPEYARDAEFLAMFMNEARIAASLHHANVVPAFDFGCEDGRYFLAMEYLRGQDIRRAGQALARAGRQVPLEIAIAIGIGAAAGLHYLHEKRDAAGQPLGLVHRDVSPPNIFLTSDGTVKLVDFGIAKAVRRAGETRTGTIKGKVSYLSPEQCRSERLDRRSDIFSLAIVLWELTVGRRLFPGDSDLMVMNAIDKVDAPRPSQLVSRYPRELERILLKGLARDRERRYRAAEEMQEDLEAFALAQRLAVTQGSVSSFVRTLPGASEVTIAALDPGTEVGPERPQEDAAVPAVSGGRTRVVKPRLVPPGAAAAFDGPPAHRWRAVVGLSAICLVGAGAGLGTARLVRRSERAATAAPPIAAPAPVAAPVPVTAPVPPPPSPPPVAAPAMLRAAHDDDVPEVSRPKHDRVRRVRPAHPPAAGGAPPTEKWSPDSALPPPP